MNQRLSGARIANTDQKSRIGKLMKADSILSFQKVVNVHVNVPEINIIHGIHVTIGSALTGNARNVGETNGQGNSNHSFTDYPHMGRLRP